MKISSEKAVREIVSQIQASIPIFETHRIDFCCNGGRSLKEACDQAGIPVENVLSSLERLMSRTPSNPDAPTPWSKKSIPELIDHILITHHNFTREQFQRLLPLSEKVARVHGTRYPELIRLQGLLTTMAEELEGHMAREEEIVFPQLRRLWDLKQNRKPRERLPKHLFSQNPVSELIWEHGMTGDEWLEVHRLTRDYTTPADACGSFRALYRGLKELEEDLHLHLHLENNILFYRLQEMGLLGS